eukprot:3563890-Prorocentrum_lima.AAC.1
MSPCMFSTHIGVENMQGLIGDQTMAKNDILERSLDPIQHQSTRLGIKSSQITRGGLSGTYATPIVTSVKARA